MGWLFWVCVAILAPIALYGLVIAGSFVCGLFNDPNKEPPSDPKAVGIDGPYIGRGSRAGP